MNKKRIIGSIIGLSLLISGTAFAAAYKNPAESVSDLTGIPVENLYEERQQGKTYGEIARENGVLDQFKDEMLQNKFGIIDERVKEGRITAEEAEALKNRIEERMESCDGTPYGTGIGPGQGLCGGPGRGSRGRGCGFGGSMGYGRGFNRK